MRAFLRVAVLVVTGCFQPTSDVPTPAAATIEGPLGSRLSVPSGAVSASTTLAIAQATVGFPALPTGAAGAVFALTPHGQTFASPVTVTLPAGNGNQLLTAQPGGAWTPVVGATKSGGNWVAQLSHFSYFVSATSSSSGGVGRVFFANGKALSVIDLSTGVESDVVPGTTDANYVTGVAVDMSASTVYWTDNVTDTVARIGMGGGPSVALHTDSDPYANPNGVAVDAAANKLFWAEASNVMNAALDGSGAAALISGTANVNFPTSVAVDASAQRVYWTDNGTDTVSSATYSGGDVQVLHTASDASANPTGVAVDAANNTLFWAEGSNVMRAALDGTGAVAVIPGTSHNFPTGVAVDVNAQVFYWTDNGTDAVSSAHYDGTNVLTLYTNPDAYSNPNGVAVAP